MKKFFLLVPTFLIGCVSFSQSMTNAQRRAMNASILQLIDSYESYSTLYSEDAAYYFLSLFKDKDAPVYCDILGNEKFGGYLPASEYAAYAVSNSKSASTSVKTVRKGESTFTGNSWVTPITFRKTYSYIDKNDVLFSSSEFFEHEEFSITVNVAYEDGEAYIKSIDGTIESQKKMPEGKYLVVKKNEANKCPVIYKGKELTYNSFDQAFATNAGLSFDDADVRVKTDTLGRGDRYSYIQYNVTPVNWRIRPRFGIAPISAYDVKFNMDPNVGSAKSSAYEIGIDFGYTFKLGRRAKLGLYLGAAMSKSQLEFSAGEIGYSYSFWNPQLEKDCEREYVITSAKEGLKFTDIVFPLYFEGEHHLNNIVSIIWNVGAKFYLNGKTDAQSSPYSITGTVKYDSVSKDLTGTYTQFLNPGSYERKKMDIAASANLGVDFNVFRNMLLVSVQVGYERAFSPTFNPGRTAWYIKEEKIYPFVYSPAQQKDIAVSSFINSTTYTRSAVWFNLGLKIKL